MSIPITRFGSRLPTFVTDPDDKLVVGILEAAHLYDLTFRMPLADAQRMRDQARELFVNGILELWDRYPTYQTATALIKAFGLAAPSLHELICDEALRSPSD